MMKIEDCEAGMKVRNDLDREFEISKIKDKKVRFKGYIPYVLPDNYEPVKPTNKFEVGDEVIWNNHKVKIWGKRYNKEFKKYEYAVTDKNNGRIFLFENELSPLKKPDELEVGDKFKVKTAEGASKRTNEVLGVFKDDYFNQTKYVAKRVQGDWKGFVDIYNSEMIEEIIYD